MTRRVLLVVALVWPVAARAQQTYEENEPVPVRAAPAAADDIVTSYRAWTATVDATSAALLLAGAYAIHRGAGDNPGVGAVMVVGSLGLGFGAPIIHAARGHGMRAAGSYLLRSAFGALGAGIGIAVAGRCDAWFCGLDEMFAGAGIGIGVAAMVDSLLLTEERRPRWVPQLAASRDGASLVVVAAF